MADYIDRKLAVKVCSDYYKDCLRKEFWGGDTLAWNIGFEIKAIPAADALEVVRCENCVSSGGDRFGELICQNQICPCYNREVDHAFSCIYGERREE